MQLLFQILNPLKKDKIKIKKTSITTKHLEFEINKDIVEYLGKNNRHRPKLVVGFSAETENLTQNATI